MFAKRFKITKDDNRLLKYRLYRVRYFGLNKQLIKASAEFGPVLDVVERLVKEDEMLNLRYKDITSGS